jgi:hypothetical protein
MIPRGVLFKRGNQSFNVLFEFDQSIDIFKYIVSSVNLIGPSEIGKRQIHRFTFILNFFNRLISDFWTDFVLFGRLIGK